MTETMSVWVSLPYASFAPEFQVGYMDLRIITHSSIMNLSGELLNWSSAIICGHDMVSNCWVMFH